MPCIVLPRVNRRINSTILVSSKRMTSQLAMDQRDNPELTVRRRLMMHKSPVLAMHVVRSVTGKMTLFFPSSKHSQGTWLQLIPDLPLKSILPPSRPQVRKNGPQTSEIMAKLQARANICFMSIFTLTRKYSLHKQSTGQSLNMVPSDLLSWLP